MSHKKKSNKERETWVPYYTRRTKTKKEKLENLERKHKKVLDF